MSERVGGCACVRARVCVRAHACMCVVVNTIHGTTQHRQDAREAVELLHHLDILFPIHEGRQDAHAGNAAARAQVEQPRNE